MNARRRLPDLSRALINQELDESSRAALWTKQVTLAIRPVLAPTWKTTLE